MNNLPKNQVATTFKSLLQKKHNKVTPYIKNFRI